MPKILVPCPDTGRPIDTGIEVDDVSFARLPSFAGRIFCPYCNREHDWSKAAVEIANDESKP